MAKPPNSDVSKIPFDPELLRIAIRDIGNARNQAVQLGKFGDDQDRMIGKALDMLTQILIVCEAPR